MMQRSVCSQETKQLAVSTGVHHGSVSSNARKNPQDSSSYYKPIEERGCRRPLGQPILCPYRRAALFPLRRNQRKTAAFLFTQVDEYLIYNMSRSSVVRLTAMKANAEPVPAL